MEFVSLFLGGFMVSGRKLGMVGDSVPVTDKSNSLILRGTKYSIRGSAPKFKIKTLLDFSLC